jgi:hypothetical protein
MAKGNKINEKLIWSDENVMQLTKCKVYFGDFRVLGKICEF